MHCSTDALYRHTAPHYLRDIAPVMAIFARDLLEGAALHPDDTVLDIGTGTGVLAHLLADRVQRVTGIDISWPMLREAHRLPGVAGLHFVQADANHLAAFAPACCDGVFASFGLSDCNPRATLKAAARMLRPGGQLFLQEWGPYSPEDPRHILDDTLADFVTREASGLRQRLREHLAELRPWDRLLQDAEDYTEALHHAGFAQVEATESRPVTVVFAPGIERFLAYALAWAPRALEVTALDEQTRSQFYKSVHRRLQPLLDTHNRLLWQPPIFRAHAVRKP